MGWLKRVGIGVVAVTMAGSIWLAIPGTRANYLARAASGQLELLLGRVDVDEVIAAGTFEGTELEQLRRIRPIKDFGATLGLSHTDNYDTINPTWDRVIWNVSASEELRFKNASWWFPIVGTVPYLGFFDRNAADAQADRLRARGYDVMLRTAGAYSTLGWFRDPVLPGMLKWTEYNLANTVLHELAHATIWLPGSVQFNESFAQFVGNVSADRYMVATYGADSPEVTEARQIREDRRRIKELLHGVYADLDALYKNPDMSSGEKRNRKQRTLAGIAIRVSRAQLNNPDRYVRWAQRTQWSNARLLQFRTYNRSSEWFAALLDDNDGDLVAFISDLERITAGASDPYEALAEAVGAVPVADADADAKAN